jgi:hypothetical protein
LEAAAFFAGDFASGTYLRQPKPLNNNKNLKKLNEGKLKLRENLRTKLSFPGEKKLFF